MSIANWLELSDDVRRALAAGRPVVALESTLIAHGMPWPINLETANAAEQAVRENGAVPATIAVWHGRPTIGLSPDQMVELARMPGVLKASRRDLAAAISNGRTAATTVAATMFLAHQASIRVFATGGIGGVHRDVERSMDVSADLFELARIPVLVVCAGAKSILDLPRTLEVLETLGVPVIGYRTHDFPAFYVRESGLPVTSQVESANDAAKLAATHWQLGGGGLILAQPVAPEVALAVDEIDRAIAQAESEAHVGGIRGGALTPYLLGRLAELTHGRSLIANQALILANARLAAAVAGAFGSAISGGE